MATAKKAEESIVVEGAYTDIRSNERGERIMFGPTQEIYGINNVPQYALNHRFWVYREVDGKRWFFGAWDDSRKAIDVATTERGWVLDTKTKEP